MIRRLAAVVLLALPLAAQTTRTWEQSRFSEFEKGTARGVALRSDGKLGLAPRFQEIYDAPTSYLWALARDSKGNVYTGGGPGARVFKIAPDGGKSTVFENEALEIHALAVDRQDNIYAATAPDSKVYKIDPAGRSTLFLDTKAKYVWAMAFNARGELFHYEVRLTYDTPEVAENRRIVEDAERRARDLDFGTGEGDDDAQPWRGGSAA